jgi:hypothetical protein
MSSVHPTVKLDYPVRVFGWIIVLIFVANSFSQRSVGYGLWALLIVVTLSWPHIAYQLASRSTNSKRFELRVLMVDCFLIGLFIVLLDFEPMVSTELFIMLIVTTISIGGVAAAVRGILSFAIACVLF